MVKRRSERINILPTWKVATGIWIRILERGTPQGKKEAEKQLLEMAGKLDKVNELRKKGKLKELG